MKKTLVQPTAEKDLIRWLEKSSHRLGMLRAIVSYNKVNFLPSGSDCMQGAMSGRAYNCESQYSNGSQAVRDLIKAGLVVNRNPKRGAQKLEATDADKIALAGVKFKEFCK